MSTVSPAPSVKTLLDPVIQELLNQEQDISKDVWNDKYRYGDEQSYADTNRRICRGIYSKDPQANLYEAEACSLMDARIWAPGGRIQAGAGTNKRVTLLNCYVNGKIDDNMESIMEGVSNAALTQQQGGGIGNGFGNVRPAGAIVVRTGSVSSGVFPFADMWHSMCQTIMSSGSRRGAMMLTLPDWHADLYRPKADYIDLFRVKQEKGRLTNFNISVLITDKFMKALEEDKLWDLGFTIPPADKAELVDQYPVGDGRIFYVYNRVPARQIFDKLTEATYTYAEPGVLFIDVVNGMNNLWYCEQIEATNPCGEQPLPPHGACDLGAVNYAMLVKRPFTAHAEIDFDLLKLAAGRGQRFLDNVLDVTHYPLKAQETEAREKRRTGNGILGLGNLLQMMGVRYGSPLSIEITRELLSTHRDAVYQSSIDMAKERGPFPLFDKDKFMKGKFIAKLPVELRDQIAEHGMRNGVTGTIAPTGNTSLVYGNVSGAAEPSFEFEYTRMVLQKDGTRKPYRIQDFGWRAYKAVNKLNDSLKPGDTLLPDYMVTALQLTVEEHLQIQAVCQEYIDASISKTINVPAEMPYEEFKNVYTRAYQLGLKGCTTYRPSGVRGAVLISDTEATKVAPAPKDPVIKVKDRPLTLFGVTYKLPDGNGGNMFLTVNCDPSTKNIFEVFLRDNTNNEYVEHAGRNLSLLLRANVPIKEIRQQLRRSGGQLSIWYNGKSFSSQLQLLDYVVFDQAANYFKTLNLPVDDLTIQEPPEPIEPIVNRPVAHSKPCPDCGAGLRSEAGCLKCNECGYSKC